MFRKSKKSWPPGTMGGACRTAINLTQCIEDPKVGPLVCQGGICVPAGMPGPVIPGPSAGPSSHNWKCVVDKKKPICEDPESINNKPSCFLSSKEFHLPHGSISWGNPWDTPCSSVTSGKEDCERLAYLVSMGDVTGTAPKTQTMGARCSWNASTKKCENPTKPQCVGFPTCKGKAIPDCAKQPVSECVGYHDENNNLCMRASSDKDSIYYYPWAYPGGPGPDICLSAGGVGGGYGTCYPPSPSPSPSQSTGLPTCMNQLNPAGACDVWGPSKGPDQKYCKNAWFYNPGYDRNSTNTGYQCTVQSL